MLSIQEAYHAMLCIQKVHHPTLSYQEDWYPTMRIGEARMDIWRCYDDGNPSWILREATFLSWWTRELED